MKDSITSSFALFGQFSFNDSGHKYFLSIFNKINFLGVRRMFGNFPRIGINYLNHFVSFLLHFISHKVSSRKSLQNIMLAVLINPFVGPESPDLRFQAELGCRRGYAIQVSGTSYVTCPNVQRFSQLKAEGREAEARALTFAAP